MSFYYYITTENLTSIEQPFLANWRFQLPQNSPLFLNNEEKWEVALLKCDLPSCLVNTSNCFVDVGRETQGSVEWIRIPLGEKAVTTDNELLKLTNEAVLLGAAHLNTDIEFFKVVLPATRRNVRITLKTIGARYHVRFSTALGKKLGINRMRALSCNNTDQIYDAESNI